MHSIWYRILGNLTAARKFAQVRPSARPRTLSRGFIVRPCARMENTTTPKVKSSGLASFLLRPFCFLEVGCTEVEHEHRTPGWRCLFQRRFARFGGFADGTKARH